MEKRRLSTRNRGEPPLKKRALTPPVTPRAPPPPTAPPQPPEPVEEGLPFRLKDPRLLPTLPEPQDLDLSAQEYQTISERSALPLLLSFSVIDQSQWCFGSVHRAVTAAMAQGRRLRTLLGKAYQEKDYVRSPKSTQRDNVQAWHLFDDH